MTKKAKVILTAAMIVSSISRFTCMAQGRNVKVISVEGENSSVIYTGPPEGYSGGELAFIDFDDKDFYVIYNWDTDELLYIYPVVTEDNGLQNGVIDFVNQTDNASNMNINGVNSANGGVVSVTIDEDMNEQGFVADYTINNMSGEQKTLMLAVAVYKNGSFINAVNETVTVQGGECVEMLVSATDGNQADAAKFFAWDSTMKPLCECVEILCPTEAGEDEIFENESKQLIPGKSYLFRPKRNGVYSFSNGENLTLYKKAFGVLTETDKNSFLFYPVNYFIEADELSDVEIEYSGDKTNAQAFLSGNYFSDMSDAGSLYKGNVKVYTSLSRWLCKGEKLYFNSDGLKKYDESTNEAVNLFSYANPYYIVTDGDTVYFADMNDGGTLCKYQNGEVSTVCNDKAAWLNIDGGYIYYKNLLDGGREYSIEKNAENAPGGSPAE